MLRDGRCLPRDPQTALVVQEREHQVVRVLVLVPILEREDLEHRVGEKIGHADGSPGNDRRRQGVGLDVALDEIVPDEMGAPDVECAELGARELALGAEDAAGWDRFVRLAKGRSSRVLRAEFPRLRRLPCLWSPSWFVSTVGGAPLEIVRRYVENL